MLSRDQCLKYAHECEAMSKVARHEENRQRLIDMAGAWQMLAALVEDGEEPPKTRKPR